ncbi:MAG: hypothetical protein Ct9H300mP12_09800 [Acidimicrobiales bacterium]|nr:MAG: hypothetical protein Ct9H300mP12_09800 [Acidimicrobiales bacterium]
MRGYCTSLWDGTGRAPRLGIVGFGSSGRELASRAKAFNMEIEAVDVVPLSPEDAEHFGVVKIRRTGWA